MNTAQAEACASFPAAASTRLLGMVTRRRHKNDRPLLNILQNKMYELETREKLAGALGKG